MGYILDLIIVLILVAAIVVSRKHGFVRSVVELVGFALAIYLAFSFGPVLAEQTFDKTIKNPVSSKISSSIEDSVDMTAQEVSDKVWETLPSFVRKNSNKFGFSKDSITTKLDVATPDSALIADNITQTIVKPIVVSGLKILFGLIIFIVIAALSKFLAKPINKIFSISVIGTLNKFLATFFGLGKGAVYSVIFCAVVSSIMVFTKSDFLIFTNENINSSHLFKLIFDLTSFN